MGIRGRRPKQLLDDPKEKRGYRKLREKAVDHSLWRTRFGRRYESVVRQTVGRMIVNLEFEKIQNEAVISGYPSGEIENIPENSHYIFTCLITDQNSSVLYPPYCPSSFLFRQHTLYLLLIL